MAELYVNIDEYLELDSPLCDEPFIDDGYHGAIIDPEGNEHPITEKMILDACAALEQEITSIYGPNFSGT